MINSRHVETLKQGKVFFGGDAAHIHSPAGGQGMNMGIQDMINLCWKLALVIQHKASSKILDTYEIERLPIIRNVVSKTEVSTEALNSTSPLVDFAIKHIAPTVLHLSSFQQFIREFLGKFPPIIKKVHFQVLKTPTPEFRQATGYPILK